MGTFIISDKTLSTSEVTYVGDAARTTDDQFQKLEYIKVISGHSYPFIDPDRFLHKCIIENARKYRAFGRDAWYICC